MRYDAALFDAAETLFTTRGSVGQLYASVAERYGSAADPEELQVAFSREFQRSAPMPAGGEKAWWKELVRRVFTEAGPVNDFDRFFEEVYDLFRDSRGWRLFPETRSVLEELSRQGLKLGIVSNFDSRLFGVLEDLGIRSYFGVVTVCSEAGYAKPQAGIFHAAVKAVDVPPHRILFIGDSLIDDYQGGQEAGLDSVLLDRAGRYAAMPSVRRIESLHDVLNLLT